MQKLIMVSFLLGMIGQSRGQVAAFDKYPVYNGKDLGLHYTVSASTFRLWAPFANSVQLRIYDKGEGGEPIKTIRMLPSVNGTWLTKLEGNWKGRFYTFSVYRVDKWYEEVPDPYAKAVGINGKRAAIIDSRETDPEGWEKESVKAWKNAADAIIYELHVRDASISENSGIAQKGRFLGLTEKGTVNKKGLSTGLDHLKELGITHVHLLPIFDYNSVDEKDPSAKYNWGYDPLNYNVPEGSYATDAFDPKARIREFKQLVKTFHENGLHVVMDVVYNHTALTEGSYFNQLVPGYYYRQNTRGGFSNATACGNETASERPMVRKFILESMKYWVQEYHIDGFRVDLMGVHDIETMNLVSRELNRIKPGILIYGEGWTAGASPVPDEQRALKKNVAKLDRIAVFSDDIRDGIKGSVFVHDEKGFASGKTDNAESIKFGIVASCPHPQVDYKKVNYSSAPYAREPWQVITYCECHDNHVLWDKLAISAGSASPEEREEMHKLALSIVLSSQGIAFLHAGTEFLRSKKGVENSFESSDSINLMDWDLKTTHENVFRYVQVLVKMRRAHPAFHMNSAGLVRQALNFRSNLPNGVIGYTINGNLAGDAWKKIMVLFNGNNTQSRVSLPGEKWNSFIHANKVANNKYSKQVEMAPYSCTILYQD